ncbi:LysR family transcriptional regulator [Labrenzia sp. 011]|uniref:helix-turn-helix domain-containing protein n=1 Tax=Labrenzia sp. 011 TaxID=2171494 RepID=UPI001FCC529C|nr:LysR family transcriptional regulator [Labrenzia sp. 011]
MEKQQIRTRNTLTLARLRALEAVVRTGNCSAAAKETGVSQPSASNHVQDLKSRFKTRLRGFRKRPSAWTPCITGSLPYPAIFRAPRKDPWVARLQGNAAWWKLPNGRKRHRNISWPATSPKNSIFQDQTQNATSTIE